MEAPLGGFRLLQSATPIGSGFVGQFRARRPDAMHTCPTVGRSLSLRRLLPGAEFPGADDILVAGCTCDSRRVGPGDLFAGLPGSRRDGREYLGQAVANGCEGVLLGQAAAGLPVPQCVVSNPREAYAQVCQALAGDPGDKLKVIGVTGTNGKTTTTCLVAGILTAAGYQVGLLGTLGYLDGRVIEAASLTTPPAEELATWLGRMLHNGCSHAVIEISSHALQQGRVAGIRLDAACLTNVTRDHLDYHRTLGRYRSAKRRLFDHLSDGGFAVVNVDDPVSAGYLGRIDGPALTVGIQSAAEITATVLEQQISEQTFLLSAGSETMPVRTEMIGTHHVYNCLVAAAVGLTYGIDLPTVVRGLEGAGQVPGRLERIECGQPFGVFVDYAHTPHALAGSLRTLRGLTAGRLICVFGAGGDRDRRKRPLMGRAVELGSDLAVLTTDNPRTEDPEAIIRQVLAGFRRPEAVEVLPDRAEAIHRGLAAAGPGDCLLIAGKGHEDCQIIGEQRVAFDDREVARQWLYDVQPYAEVGGKV
jgi:UDP-N-acetylmuramoyl-L-alanyl-D-glutamate--2,6-diaminopimelate ligase